MSVTVTLQEVTPGFTGSARASFYHYLHLEIRIQFHVITCLV